MKITMIFSLALLVTHSNLLYAEMSESQLSAICNPPVKNHLTLARKNALQEKCYPFEQKLQQKKEKLAIDLIDANSPKINIHHHEEKKTINTVQPTTVITGDNPNFGTIHNGDTGAKTYNIGDKNDCRGMNNCNKSDQK